MGRVSNPKFLNQCRSGFYPDGLRARTSGWKRNLALPLPRLIEKLHFLRLLRAGRPDYMINSDAITYWESHKLPRPVIEVLSADQPRVIANDAQWDLYISFWESLKDRLEKTQLIPKLAQLIRNRSIQQA